MRISSRQSCVAVALMLLGRLPSAHSQTPVPTPQPYASIAADGEGYAGPGRSVANDLAGQVIRIGLLAPMTGARKSEGDSMVAAAQMALRDAAPNGLAGGRRITLAIEDSSGPSWGLVSDAVIRLVLEDDVIALITSTSGADAHLSEQVGNRVGVAVLTLSADATTTQIDVPWIFRIGASDAVQAQLIARDLYRARHLQHTLLITQHGHDGDRASAVMRQAAADLGAETPDVLVLDPDNLDLVAMAKDVTAKAPQALVIWTSAAVASTVLRTIRSDGVAAPCYLSSESASDLSNADAADRPAGETLTIAEEPENSTSRQAFPKRFQDVTGHVPNSIATRTYDAVTLVVRAVQTAGPNRARVRDRLSQDQTLDGAYGKSRFDREGNDLSLPRVVKLK